MGEIRLRQKTAGESYFQDRLHNVVGSEFLWPTL